METVVKELVAAGATVVDASIPDLDARYLQARGSAPGSLKAGWTAYLTRGAKEGEPVLTIDSLLASGKLAPVSARRLRDALQPTPSGDELRAATATFYATRDEFRGRLSGRWTSSGSTRCVPANLARPSPHEGGLGRTAKSRAPVRKAMTTAAGQKPAGFLAHFHSASFLDALGDGACLRWRCIRTGDAPPAATTPVIVSGARGGISRAPRLVTS
jgi:hypothetical protein